VRACYAEGKRARGRVAARPLLATDVPTHADAASLVADRDQLERGFRRLSIDHRAVIVLHHYLGMPFEQVADALGVPAGTVRSRHHHALRGLRAALEADARPPLRGAAR
jgi:RNA polymerase sigma-70 factor (ECF subfamily)